MGEKMRKKIAFVHYPHGPKSARLETMPFALNSVIALAAAGWKIDLYLWERPLWGQLASNYDNLLPKNVTVRYFTELRYNPFNRWRHIWLKFRFQWHSHYLCVFGLGQIGAYIGNLVAKANNCPFIYIIDEFPSNWPSTTWSKLEQQAAKDAVMVVVPDTQQFPFLCKELHIPLTKPYAALPNVAAVYPLNEQTNWHAKLGLPKNSIPFLYAGSVSAWAQVPELLSSLPDWPEPAVLVVHSRSKREIQTFRQQYSHLEVENRIFWSSEPLPQVYLNSLVFYCEGNFALYCNTGLNIEYVGFSSGKLMRSLACGSPVIASKLSSFTFVTDHKLGVLVEDAAEIPDAVKQIMGNREEYRKRCLDFCETYASFEAHWPRFCEELMNVTKIDLQKPISSYLRVGAEVIPQHLS